MDNNENRNVEDVILDCAEKLFSQKGFSNTKVLSIAQDANVNHALINYYFRTKDNLYDRVVERLFERWKSKIKTISWNGNNPQEIITSYIRQFFWFHVESDNFQKIRMWDRIEQKNVFDRYIKKYWSDDLEAKSKEIDKWKTEGLINTPVDSHFIMHTIWMVVNSFYSMSEAELQSMFKNDSSLVDNQNLMIEQIICLILRSLKN